MTVKDIAKLIRIDQWQKNLIVFTPLLFSEYLFKIEKILDCIFLFLFFCIISSLVYVVNDLADIEKDKKHFLKKNRPLPSGRISRKESYLVIFLIIIVSIFLLKLFNNKEIIYIFSIYLIINLFYTFIFKYIVILDILFVASGYVLRLISGNFLIEIEISPYLTLGIAVLSILILSCKRKIDHLYSKEKNVKNRIYKNYNFMNIFIYSLSVILFFIYFLFCLENYRIYQNKYIFFSFIFVLISMIRFLFLINIKEIKKDITKLISTDKIIITSFIFWSFTIITMFNF